MDYYEILEVNPKASQEVIQNAYRALAKKYHPDTCFGDKNTSDKMMVLINNAYFVLSDPQRRRQYDDNSITKNNNPQTQKQQETRHSPEYETMSAEMQQVYIARKKAILNNEQILDKPSIRLYTFNGIGTTFLGEEDYDINSNSLITRFWFTFIYLPLIPIGRYRVIKKDGTYLIISKITSKQSFNKILKAYYTQPRFIFIILVVIFISFNPTKAKPLPNKPLQQSSQKQPQVQPAFIPKTGILTQYVPNQPINNSNGYCTISIDNTKNKFPVIVRVWNLSPQIEPVRTITVKAHEIFTAEKLDSGKYEIRYMHLYENIQSTDVFKSEQFSLTQHETESGVEYSTITLTLYKVANGNTHTYPISIGEL